MESRSLKVTVFGTLMLSKSTVIPNGTEISSVLAYLRPIDPEESSTLKINQVSIILIETPILY